VATSTPERQKLIGRAWRAGTGRSGRTVDVTRIELAKWTPMHDDVIPSWHDATSSCSVMCLDFAHVDNS